MAELLVQLAVIGGATVLLWKFLKRYVVKSVLDNLPGPPSSSLVYGNVKQVFNPDGWDFHKELGEKYGPAVLLRTMFGRKMLYVFDPKAMHSIAIKDQWVYDEQDWWLRVNHVTLGPGLLACKGEQHRHQRKMLNPAFNASHIKEMLPIFYDVIHRLGSALKTRVAEDATEIDVASWMGRTALELIGQAGLGYSFDPLTEEREDAYGDALKSYIPLLYQFSSFLQFVPFMEAVIPRSWCKAGAKWIPHEGFQKLLAVVNAMEEHSTKIYAEKKAALARGDKDMKRMVGQGKDLMSILLRANMTAEGEERLTEEELIGQMSTITASATDTTSNLLSRILHVLAQHPDAQSKLRKEIVEAQSSGKEISYDDLTSLPYLDAVCRETLRVYVPTIFRFRETNRDIVLPLSESIRGRDGQLISEIPLPKDTPLFIGIQSSNTSKALWGEDAYEWKPERWLSPLPESVLEAKIPGIYSNLMTFWGGSRACIGFKFSQLEMKAVLAELIPTFTFELTDKPINWKLASITYPTTGHESKSGLPLKLTLVNA